MIELLGALVLIYALAPIAVRWCLNKGIVDYPGENSIHATPIPTMGGVLLVVIFLVILNIHYFIFGLDGIDLGSFITLQAIIILVSLVGLIDDIHSLKATPKLLIIIGASILFSLSFDNINQITIPFSDQLNLDPVLSLVLTVLWITFITNAINLIDGLDGLLASYSAIYFLALLAIGMIHGVGGSFTFAAIMAGLMIGFYFYNKPPARLFAGNVGSHFVGFMIAITPLIGRNKAAAAITFSPVLILLLFPVIDMATQFFRRLSIGKNPFHGDLMHFHHLCYYLTNGTSRYLSVLNWIFLANAAIGILSVLLDPSWRMMMMITIALINCVIVIGTMYYVRNNKGKTNIINFNQRSRLKQTRKTA